MVSTKTPPSIDALVALIPPIFTQVQHSAANHRKNSVALFKVQEKCAEHVQEIERGGDVVVRLVGEKAFNAKVIEMIDRVLVIKKGVTVADRVLQFVGKFVAYASQQDSDDSSALSRLVNKLLRHLLQGSESRDKAVRYRVLQGLVTTLHGLEDIDDELYAAIRDCLVARSEDKEASVRVQAAIGLGQLADGEEDDELEQVLLHMLRHDPAPEVRRAALYGLPRNPSTLPAIIERSRDVDVTLRRIVYAGPLKSLPQGALSAKQREAIARAGLSDREAAVRRAAAGVLAEWFDAVEGDPARFLRDHFDLTESEAAADALLSLFTTRRQALDAVAFDDAFWEDLTPERALIARVTVEHCLEVKDERRLEAVLPVGAALAYYLQESFNRFVELAKEEAPAQDVIYMLRELCKLALHVDYSDELGRRKVFQLAREMICEPLLADDLVPGCVAILSKISDNERDLIRVVVDVITELRDPVEEDRSRAGSVEAFSIADGFSRRRPQETLTPEQREQRSVSDLRCLAICINLLESVNGTLQENSVFHGLLPDLIVPACTSKSPGLRSQGLICLGLVCMIDQRSAHQSFGLFLQQLQQAEGELGLKIAQVVFDLLMVHDIGKLIEGILPPDGLVGLVRHTLNSEAADVQAVACQGAAKLMLSGRVYDETLLRHLVLLYLSPETADNQSLSQCLSYFFPVYCYSSAANQQHMRSILVPTLELLAETVEDPEIAAEMLPLPQMALLLVDWTDPLKVVGGAGDLAAQLDTACDLVEAAEEAEASTKKVFLGLLGKLYLPDEVEDTKLHRLLSALSELSAPSDATSRNALKKFTSSLEKKYPEQHAAFNGDGERTPRKVSATPETEVEPEPRSDDEVSVDSMLDDSDSE